MRRRYSALESPLMSRWLPSELRRKSVYVHLVILVVRPWPNRSFNDLTYGVDGFAFPDANAEAVIVGSRMDWQGNVEGSPASSALASAA
jgi:hypothetical protein